MFGDCPLCEVPETVVWRSSRVVGWRQAGSFVVAPMRHVSDIRDLDDAERIELWAVVADVQDEVRRRAGSADGVVSMVLVASAHFALRIFDIGERPVQLTHGPSQPLEPRLLDDIDGANQIDIAVAFVWEAGLARIFPRLEECQERGGRIRFLTGDYGDATEPRALRRLFDLTSDNRNTELRIFETSRARTSFHPKAYLLSSARRSSVAYVGSSNLSVQALSGGVEWNFRVTEPGGVADAQTAFDALFVHEGTRELTHAWIDAYEKRRTKRAPAQSFVPDPEPAPPAFEPHGIQQEALAALRKTRAEGNRAGLVVLATGLGKTWLSAFDSEDFSRVLFVAHREEILQQARNTFRAIRRDDRLGMFVGGEKDVRANVMFASIQTLSRRANLELFDPGHFDYVVVDEFHHASARTYRGLIRHFEPKFLLGLTATPERSDGGDLLALCDENLVYRCNLVEGIRRERLCPFHYFGIPDDVDYAQIPWRSTRFDEEELTRSVATNARADNALEQWREKGGKRTLAFCVSRRHANFMRDYFRGQGVRAVAVHSGPDSDGRIDALQRLEEGAIDVLFAVDMFNEGLDVRSIDTVLMLRPTESKILWLQQIGRGLRKADGKPHLTIIDYIGNHNVFLNKPAALLGAFGDVDLWGRELMRRIRSADYDLPPGCSVTYDLRAIEILESLFPATKPMAALEAWYTAFRDDNGARPTALQAYQSRYNPLATGKGHGSWFAFVDAMGDLDDAERAAIGASGGLVTELATGAMPRADRLVVIDALLALKAIPGEVSIGDLSRVCRRVIERSAVLRGELEGDEASVRKVVESWRALWIQGDVVGTALRSATNKDVLENLLTEIVEWRLAKYVEERRAGIRFKVMRNASDKAILKIDRARFDLPEGWVTVDLGDAPYKAKFMKAYVNVVARSEAETNQLDALMRRWFGPDAGKRGTTFSVAHEARPDGTYRWSPSVYGGSREGVPIRADDGEPIDARFTVEELDDRSLTIVVMSRNKGRNDEYSRGLEIILRRLAERRLKIVRIAVDSESTRASPIEERTLAVADAAYPIALDPSQDLAGLRRRIGRAMAAIGRAPGAKGSGNSNKRIRIWVGGTADEASLRESIG